MRSMMMTMLLVLGATGFGQAFECRDYVESMRVLGATDIYLNYANEMRLQGDAVYAISLNGWKLVTVDVSDLAAPEQTDVVVYETPTTGIDVGAAGLLVTITGVGLVRYDLADPFVPVAVDTLDLGHDMLDVVLADDVAFVTMVGGMVRAVALDYPGGMLPLGSFQLPSVALVIDHEDGWLYLGTFGHGLMVVAAANPSALQYGGSAAFVGQPESIDIGHGLLALGGDGGGGIVTVYDIANPVAPLPITTIVDPVAGHIPPTPTIVSPDRLFVAGPPTGLREYHLAGGAYHLYGVWVGSWTHFLPDGERFALLAYDEVHAGLMGPLQPGPGTEIVGSSANAILRDGYLFAQPFYELFIVDASDPAALAVAGHVQVGSGNIQSPANALHGSAYYASRYLNGVGIDIVDVQDVANPVHVGFMTLDNEPGGMLAEGDLLYVAETDHGLGILDLADPWNPQPLGYRSHAIGECHGMLLFGDQLLVASGPAGVDVFDVSDPLLPILADAIPSGPVAHIARSGDRLLVAPVVGLLQTWIRQPGGPWILTASGPVDDVVRVTVNGSVAYALRGGAELAMLDLSGPGAPVHTGGFPTLPPRNSTVVATDTWVTVTRDYTYRFFAPQCPYGVTAAPLPAPSVETTLTAAPNPFNPNTRFRFELPRAGRVQLRMYDLRGRLVDTLLDGPVIAGRHHADWHGTDSRGRSLPSGVYHARLIVDGTATSLKVSLLK